MIARLFMGGFLPGIMIGIGLMIVVYVVARRRGCPKEAMRAVSGEIRSSFVKAFPALMTGIFTPTEAAVVAIVYAYIPGFFVYRSLKVSNIVPGMLRTSYATAPVLAIMEAASVFGWVMTLENTPMPCATRYSPSPGTHGSSSPCSLSFFLFSALFRHRRNTPRHHSHGHPDSEGPPYRHGPLRCARGDCGLPRPSRAAFRGGPVHPVESDRSQGERDRESLVAFFIPILLVILLVAYVPGLVLFIPNLVMGKAGL